MIYSDRQIAAVIHDANRRLQIIQNDPMPSLPWEAEDPAIKDQATDSVRQVRHGATAAELHQFWCRAKIADGWRYGPEKDSVKKTHPCLVDFDQLPEYQQDKSRVFTALVWALYTKDEASPDAPAIIAPQRRGRGARRARLRGVDRNVALARPIRVPLRQFGRQRDRYLNGGHRLSSSRLAGHRTWRREPRRSARARRARRGARLGSRTS